MIGSSRKGQLAADIQRDERSGRDRHRQPSAPSPDWRSARPWRKPARERPQQLLETRLQCVERDGHAGGAPTVRVRRQHTESPRICQAREHRALARKRYGCVALISDATLPRSRMPPVRCHPPKEPHDDSIQSSGSGHVGDCHFRPCRWPPRLQAAMDTTTASGHYYGNPLYPIVGLAAAVVGTAAAIVTCPSDPRRCRRAGTRLLRAAARELCAAARLWSAGIRDAASLLPGSRGFVLCAASGVVLLRATRALLCTAFGRLRRARWLPRPPRLRREYRILSTERWATWW